MESKDFIKDFIEEANENLETLEQELFQLEKGSSDKDLIDSIFRCAHTLKGSAAFLDFKNINQVTHEMETIFDKIRRGKLEINGSIIDILFESIDKIKDMVEKVINVGNDDYEIEEIVSRLNSLHLKGSINLEEYTQKQPEVYLYSKKVDALLDNIDDAFVILNKKLKCSNSNKKAEKILGKDWHQGDILKILYPEEDFKNIREFFSAIFDKEHNSKRKLYLSLLPSHTKIDDKLIKAGYNLINENGINELMIVLKKIEIDKETETDNIKIEVKDEKIETPSQSKEKKIEELKMIRVDKSRIDYTMNLVGELVTGRNRLIQIASQFESTELKNSVKFIGNLTSDLQSAIMKMRMISLKKTFNKFPRIVRDLSKKLGKEINIEIAGEETELDRIVTDEIYEPLLHMVRNAIDHGIEMPEQREESNKSRFGTVKINAIQEDNFVYIEISDDGKGIDEKKIKEKAIEKGIISKKEAGNLTQHEAVNLIFEPGFSTSENISDLSGRGVGMDVVRNKIEELSGIVDIITEKGKGSIFRIRLPLTLAIMKVLIIEVTDKKYAIPLNSVIESIRVEKSKIKTVSKNEMIFLRGKPLPIVYLSSVFNIREYQKLTDKLNVVVLGSGEKRVGLVIDDMLGKKEIVIKPIGKYLGDVKGVSGATILGDGSIITIIDSNYIVNKARSFSEKSKLIKKNTDKKKYKILCVDDSRSIQKLLRDFLTKNGYETETSENGSMALRKTKMTRYDLIISDYDMPKMNGYEFIKNLRMKRGYKFSPVILLTSFNKEDISEDIESLKSITFCKKPVELDNLLEIVKTAIR